jgi:ATP-dependent Clp endopeptidase proteolytic subunit ClpP
MSKIVRESIDRFFDYDVYPESRIIYAGCVYSSADDRSGVEAHMAERVIKAILVLSQTPDKPIRIILNSPGGFFYDGMAIYDAIKACPCHVVIEVLGHAMSMASIILQAADERIVHPNATLMIHDGSDSFSGHARNLEVWAAEGKRLRHLMYDIYAERSGKDAKYWEKKCAFDYVLPAEKAVEEGLADSIYGKKR